MVALGASQRLTPTAVTDALDHFDGVEMVVSQLEVGLDVVEAGLVEAKKRGITTVLNTAPFSPLSPAILDATDWLIANEVEAASLVGADSATLDSRSVRDSIATWAESLGVNLIVTLGGEGAIGCVAGEVRHSAAPAVTAVDTVGAGDLFRGLLLQLPPRRYELAAGHEGRRPRGLPQRSESGCTEFVSPR